MNDYVAYGLGLRSELTLPDLQQAPKGFDADVSIVRGPLDAFKEPDNLPDGADGWMLIQPGQGTVYGYPNIARYLVRIGEQVVVDAHPQAEPDLVRHILLGPVLTTLLWQRDLLTLHACVLRMNGRTVAFMGASGEGKSTLANALLARGHTLLSDDVAAIPWRTQPVSVLPGFPRMKVYPEVMRQLGADPDASPPVYSGLPKRAVWAERFAHSASELHAMYVLTSADALDCRPVASAQALLTVMQNAYRPGPLVQHVGRQALMQMCARIVERVPLHALSRPRKLEQLPQLAEFVEQQVAT